MSDANPSAQTVFLSYANSDRDRVAVLVAALEAEGMNVWWDQEIPRGQNFNRVIETALGQAQCAIVVWSASSVKSEWVFNEASEARKRQILVPALIDDVEPPLEFRHLQAARLVDWNGEAADAEWKGLRDAVRGLLKQPSGPVSPPAVRAANAVPAWWQTPAGMGVGLGALLVGAALLLMALNQVGLFRGPAPASVSDSTGGGPATTPGAEPPAPQPASSSSPAATTGTGTGAGAAAVTAASSADRLNLLDPANGGTLAIANEDGWRRPIAAGTTSTTLSNKGFAVFAFRDEKPVRIDAVGVYVEYTAGRNVKNLVISASDQSETGPFRKIADITVPNYRNMRGPVHEFAVPPFSARYVKVEIAGFQDGPDYPNGYIGTLRLFGRYQ